MYSLFLKIIIRIERVVRPGLLGEGERGKTCKKKKKERKKLIIIIIIIIIQREFGKEGKKKKLSKASC